MEETTEKYPVCPERNTPAAYRWFFQPLSPVERLRARAIRRPAAAAWLSATFRGISDRDAT
jgi:hypothetical protein